MIFLALNLLESGVQLSMVCAAIGLVFALILIAIVIRAPAGNERMRQIASAVEDALRPFEISIRDLPVTPTFLRAATRARSSRPARP